MKNCKRLAVIGVAAHTLVSALAESIARKSGSGVAVDTIDPEVVDKIHSENKETYLQIYESPIFETTQATRIDISSPVYDYKRIRSAKKKRR